MRVPIEVWVKTLGKKTFTTSIDMAPNVANQIASGNAKILKMNNTTYVPFHAVELGVVTPNSSFIPPHDNTCIESGGDGGYTIMQDAEGNFTYKGLPYQTSGLFAELNNLGDDMPDIELVSNADPSLSGTYTFDSKGADMGGPYLIYKMENNTMRLGSNGVSVTGGN